MEVVGESAVEVMSVENGGCLIGNEDGGMFAKAELREYGEVV